jgi:hypothetical protein
VCGWTTIGANKSGYKGRSEKALLCFTVREITIGSYANEMMMKERS